MSEAAEEQREVIEGEGYAAGNIDGMGEGWGFRKIRKELGVNEMGVNAVVMPPGYEAGFHFHDEQEEVYIVLSGLIRFTFGDKSQIVLGPGGVARVDAATHRKFANAGEGDATYVCFGAKGGYVGRDGRSPEGENPRPDGPPGAQ